MKDRLDVTTSERASTSKPHIYRIIYEPAVDRFARKNLIALTSVHSFNLCFFFSFSGRCCSFFIIIISFRFIFSGGMLNSIKINMRSKRMKLLDRMGVITVFKLTRNGGINHPGFQREIWNSERDGGVMLKSTLFFFSFLVKLLWLSGKSLEVVNHTSE